MNSIEAGAFARPAAAPKSATIFSTSASDISTGGREKMALGTIDGASGTISGISDWLPAWLSSAKMTPPRRCTASVTRERGPMRPS